MNTATITVARIEIPDNVKAPRKVRDSTGKVWKAWPNDFGSLGLEDGATYEVQYKEDYYEKTGQTDYVIKKATKSAGPGRAVLPKNNYRQSLAPAEDEKIFVVAIVKSLIEAGQIEFHDEGEDIINAIGVVRRVYRETFGAEKAQQRDDLDDSIRF